MLGLLTSRCRLAVAAFSITVGASACAPDPGATACSNLTAQLGNEVVTNHSDPAYLASQAQYFNAKQSAYAPACIVYPTTADHVSVALKAIKAAGSRFAVKTAGHNPNNFFSSVDNGVLIDLNRLNQRTYDAETTLGTFQPGGKFGDIYDYFAQFGRTVVGARLAGVGTGLVLGGGLSFLSPQYGMACDSFRELEIVLPSGEIVTASPTENEDLFFGSRGGGGNAYGIVTKYTVQTRPSGTFYAGNIFYNATQTAALMAAVSNFTKYNTDPKATIIGTWERLITPAPGLNLDSFEILFLVYDGPNPGDAFTNFTSIPYVINTMGEKTYSEVVNLPTPGSAEMTRGDNSFWVVVHDFSDESYIEAIDAWRKWCDNNQGSYVISTIAFQPVPKSLTDASNAQNGGNAMQMPDGPWFWINFLITTVPGTPESQYDAIEASFKDMVNSVPSAKGLPLFINDAHRDQDPLKTFSTFPRLQQIKAKYDPEGFFSNFTGGWSFE